MRMVPSLNRLALSGAMAALLFAAGACSKPKAGPPKNPTVPVLAGDVTRKDMPVLIRAIGRVESPATVSVKPQVSGQISEIHFTEGQTVKKGDLLFTIDPRPFEAVRAQAEAASAQAKAQAANAAEQAQRYSRLDRSGTVAKEQVDQLQMASVGAAAAVQAADAALRTAQLQLEYCSVKAPISGRAGKYLVDSGNVVRVNETDLVVINQIAPIEVTFSVAERHLPEIQARMAEGKLPVKVTADGQTGPAPEGELAFVDNAVKATSGTIELKATFGNDPQVLWPGQFVEAELLLRTEPEAVVAPARAVQSGQKGNYVFVIKPDFSVEPRPIALDRTIDTEAVIREGLKGGEKVVIDGQSRLIPGSKVEIKTSLDALSSPQTAKLTRQP